MSFATLQHDNRSRHAVDQLEGTYSATIESRTGSEDSLAVVMNKLEIIEEDIEWEDLTRRHNGSRDMTPMISPKSKVSHRDGEEKSLTSPMFRRASSPTRQSVKLFAPEEETSVIRKSTAGWSF